MITRILILFFVAFLATVSAEQTPAPQSAKSNFRFVVLADSRGDDHGTNGDIIRKILAQVRMLEPQPLFAAIPGDMVVGSKDESNLRGQMAYFKKVITEFYPMDFYHLGLGNHEVMNNKTGERIFAETFHEMKGAFLDGYNKTVYHFDHGNTRLFMLNNDHPGEEHMIGDDQLAWVRKNLDAKKSHNVFFMHEPSYPTGYNIGNAMDVDPFMRGRFWEVADSLKSAIVFNGHEHFYSRRHINREYNETVNGKKFEFEREIYQVTVGGFGGPLTSNFVDKPGVDVPPIGEYHFAVVDITEKSIEVTVNNLDGKQLDHFIVP